MGDVRFPDKPASNVFDNLYGENAGKIVRIPATELGDDYDVVLVVSSSLHTKPYPVVESGSLFKVFNKCKNNEKAKVLLKHRTSDSYVKFYEPITISLDGESLSIGFKTAYSEEGSPSYGEYIITYTSENAIISGTCSECYYNDTKQNQGQNNSVSHDLVINIDHDWNFEFLPVDGYSFNGNDVYNVWEKVKSLQEASVLIIGTATMDSSSTKYHAQFRPISIGSSYDTDLYIVYGNPWGDLNIRLKFDIDQVNRTGTLVEIERKVFELVQ